MDRQMMLQFGIQLKRLRKGKKLSQSRLGKAVGVHYNRIGKYELGTAYPSVPVLLKLSEVLEMSMDDMLRGAVSGQGTVPGQRGAAQTLPVGASPASSSAASIDQDRQAADERFDELVQKIKTLPPDDLHIATVVLEAFVSRRAVSDLLALGRG